MSRFIAVVISCLMYSSLMGQSHKNPSDSSILFFKWDIVNKEKGSLMYLDVPYRVTDLNYVSLTVAKPQKKSRPNFISIALPSNINKEKGLFLSFIDNLTDTNNNRKPIKASFTETNKETYIVRFFDGYSLDKKTDIFSKFLKNRYLILTFYSKNNKSKNVIIGLFNFKWQYQDLL